MKPRRVIGGGDGIQDQKGKKKDVKLSPYISLFTGTKLESS